MKTTSTSLGTILTDAQGRSLYSLTNNGEPILCSGICASQWPPLTVAAGARPFGAPGVGPLGTTRVSGNGNQVTWRGRALYRFIGDPSPGSTKGEGIASFGGVWHVASVSGGGLAVAPSRQGS